jgi:hypothetical protein
VLHVWRRTKHPDTGEYLWNDVGRVELDNASETSWTHIECGDNYERCSHYAWFHCPELQGMTLEPLGTAKFLGREPMRRHDVIAYVLDGIRYQRRDAVSAADTSGAPIFPRRFAAPFTTRDIGLKKSSDRTVPASPCRSLLRRTTWNARVAESLGFSRRHSPIRARPR